MGLLKKPLSCLFSLFILCLALVIVIGIVGIVVVDHFAVDVASRELQQRSGFAMTAGKQDISVLGGSVDLQDLQVTNPGRFASNEFVKLNQLKVVAEPTSVLGKQLVVDELVIDVDSFAIVYNKDGELNLLALENGLLGKSSTAPAASAGASKAAGPAIPPFLIKKLTLRIKSAKLIDFRHGGTPQVTDLSYDRTFTDVTQDNMDKVAVQIGMDLSGKGFGFLLDALKEQLLDPDTYLNAAKGIGGAVINGVGNVVNGVGNALKGIMP